MKKQRKLVYWVAVRREDSEAYSIRRKTKQECLAEIKKRECIYQHKTESGEIYWSNNEYSDEFSGWEETYIHPVKIEIPYSNLLDIVHECLGEGGLAK